MKNDTSILASLQNLLGEDFNLSLLVSIIKKSLVWFFILIGLAVAFVVLYLRYTLPVYEAQATLMLKTEKKSEILGIKDVLSYQSDEIRREIEIMKSKFLIGRALDNLPLKVSYFREGRTKLVSSELYDNSPFWVDVKTVSNPRLYGVDIYLNIIDSRTFNIRYISGNTQVDEVFKFGQYFESGNGALELKI
ncbi:MAG: Wzz/FepE/Etk N-terminal domain-containing protein, partial [Cytophagales bacterium]|nr:Wzz/FepE/Etk N-terminal domain-containing protein [Cytophagales bacterium]